MGSPTRVQDQCGPLNNYQQYMQHTSSSYIAGLPMSPNSHQSQIFQLGCPSVTGKCSFSIFNSNRYNFPSYIDTILCVFGLQILIQI